MGSKKVKRYLKEDLEPLLDNGFSVISSKTEYELLRLKGPCTVVLYTTGKLLFQGKHDAVTLAKALMGESVEVENKSYAKKTSFDYANTIITGSDETLKGDTFGGLIVVGVSCDIFERELLEKIGVRDSKTISDVDISLLAKKIKEIVHYKIEHYDAKKYNAFLEKGSLTGLMNALHKNVFINGTHVVDKYPGCAVGDFKETKAESKYVEIAAASIIARDEALKQFHVMEKQLGFRIPKGSTHVRDALLRLSKSGKNPKAFVKMHFSNVKEVFN